MRLFNSMRDCVLKSGELILHQSVLTDTEAWQSEPQKNLRMREVFGYSFKVLMDSDIPTLRKQLLPDYEWADFHFLERVSGNPLNPGDSYQKWPYYSNAEREDLRWKPEGSFSHTYMERFWPKFANGHDDLKGIRYPYGDLIDIVYLLLDNPTTRQAYLPIYFPEDTSSRGSVRVPCTLGYLFNIRSGFLHVTYYIRSCDYLRHFANDVYLCNLLANWVVEQLKLRDTDEVPRFSSLKLGFMFFHCQSFHVFENDSFALSQRIGKLSLPVAD